MSIEQPPICIPIDDDALIRAGSNAVCANAKPGVVSAAVR